MNPVRRFLFVPLLACALLTLPGASAAAECPQDETRLCLQEGRFQVQVSWTDHDGNSGEGRASGITGDTGAFWFFNPDNLEVMVKVLDGRAVNGHFWVFYGALSDVRYTLTVTDTATGTARTYTNPPGQLASRADTEAFPDPEAPAGAAPLAKISAASTLSGSPELQVNVATQFAQRFPSLAVDDQGNVMVVWASDHTQRSSLYGRIYDARGNPRTGEFLVAEPSLSSFLTLSKVAANRAGEFLVVWVEDGLQEDGVLARRFGGDGQPLGSEVRLNAAASAAGPPDIARRPQGGFVAVWADGTSVRALLLDEQGNPVGPEIGVVPATSQVGEPRVSVSSAGNFVVTWITGTSPFETDVLARRFDADGRPQGEAMLVNGVAPYRVGYQSGAIPVAFPDGSFTVFWHTALFFQAGRLGVFSRFFPSGLPPGEIQELHSPGTLPYLSPLALAMDDLGRILLLWSGEGPGDEGGGVFGRILGPTGRPDGEIFLVNVFTGELQTEPAVVARPTGGFVAVWSSGSDYPLITPRGDEGLDSQDGHFFGVFGRRLALCSDAVSLCLGDRFRVQVSWTDHDGNTGAGRAVPLTADTGAFWFFGEENLELMIKVLDGRPVNDHFWVFYGALSDVRYTITVTDTATETTRTYTNPPGQLASRADTEAFPGE